MPSWSSVGSLGSWPRLIPPAPLIAGHQLGFSHLSGNPNVQLGLRTTGIGGGWESLKNICGDVIVIVLTVGTFVLEGLHFTLHSPQTDHWQFFPCLAGPQENHFSLPQNPAHHRPRAASLSLMLNCAGHTLGRNSAV